MKQLIALVLLWNVTLLSAQVNRKMCISIDDMPVVSYGIDNEQDIIDGLIASVKKHKVPAIGYVNAGKLFKEGPLDSSRLGYIQQWLDAGLEIGNHTYAHKNYHAVSFEEYTQDILDGEKEIKKLVEDSGEKFRFFRHPYLRSGADSLTTIKLKNFLTQNGYQEAFVTVDDDDYLFALAFARAYKKDDEELMDKIGAAYLAYMKQKIVYFEKVSFDVFGRNINHTLLIHANFLNATYLDQLLNVYKELGYSFISQEEAISDEAYSTPVTKFGDWGISWIHKWGMSAGMGNELFKGDPRTPDFILELAD